MNKYKIFIVAFLVLMIFISLGLLMYNFYVILETRTLAMQFEIGDKIGMNADTDALYFGKSYPGSVVKRYLNMSNNNNFPLFVSIIIKGDIAQFISVSDNDFELQPGELKVITYFLRTDKNSVYGNYTGQTTILFKRLPL
jgi:hypothetical protein